MSRPREPRSLDAPTAAVAILTLAVGAGANTAIFSVLHAVVLRDLPYGDVDRLALLWTFNTAQHLRDGSSFLNVRDWKEQSRAFEDIVVYRRPEHTRATIASTSAAAGDREQTSERVDITLVGPGFFQLLDAAPLLGRTLEDADFASGHRPVVISHELWRRRFGGDPHAIGRTVDIDNTTCQIVGVMTAEFAFPRPAVHLWLPISVLSEYRDRMQTDPRARGGDPLMAIGRLRPSVSIDTARAEMDTIAARLRDAYPDANGGKGFFEAMGIPLLRGRSLRDADLDLHALARVVVVNEAMARRFWPGEDAVGKRFKYGRGVDSNEPWTTVVGVVADMRRQRLDETPIPYMFRPGVPRDITFTVRTVGDPAPLRQALRAELLAVEPAAPPFGIITVEERLDETVALRTLQTLLLGTLAAAALVLAVIGVYGIIHQSVVARTREIGVWMALGASRPSVLRMILARALALATTGLAIGLMGALALGQTIAAFLYETSPLDPLIYAAVAALLIAVTTVACIVPARRAARIDPMIALRAD